MLSDRTADLEAYQNSIGGEALVTYGGARDFLIDAYNDGVQSGAPRWPRNLWSLTHGGSFNQRFTNETILRLLSRRMQVVQITPTTMDGGMRTQTQVQRRLNFLVLNQGLADERRCCPRAIRKGPVHYGEMLPLKSGQPYLSGKQMISGNL